MKQIKKMQFDSAFMIKAGAFTFIAWLFLFGGMDVMAQVGYGQIEAEVKKATTSIRKIVEYILYAALFIALIHVIYSVATSNPKMKDIIIAWGVALIVLYLGMTLLPA